MFFNSTPKEADRIYHRGAGDSSHPGVSGSAEQAAGSLAGPVAPLGPGPLSLSLMPSRRGQAGDTAYSFRFSRNVFAPRIGSAWSPAFPFIPPLVEWRMTDECVYVHYARPQAKGPFTAKNTLRRRRWRIRSRKATSRHRISSFSLLTSQLSKSTYS